MATQSDRRLIENEQSFRDANEKFMSASDYADRYNMPLYFFCECSDTDCTKHIAVPYRTYERIHKQRNRFIILPGHENLQVEQVVDKPSSDFVVVEKYGVQPD